MPNSNQMRNYCFHLTIEIHSLPNLTIWLLTQARIFGGTGSLEIGGTGSLEKQ